MRRVVGIVGVLAAALGIALAAQGGTNDRWNVTGGVSDGTKGDIVVSGGGTTWTIDNSVVDEATLKMVNGPTDEYCLTYESTTGDFEWQTCGSGGVSDGDKGDITVAGSGTSWTIDAAAVQDADLRSSAATSVIGQTTGSAGPPADIAASADGQVLRRAGGGLAFGALDLTDADGVTGALTLANGGTGLSSAADDRALLSNGTSWVATAIGDCDDSGGNHLNYDTGTNAFSCGTTSSGGGGWTYDNTTVDVTNSTTTPATTNITLTLAASTTYFIRCQIVGYAAATTTGLQLTTTYSGTMTSGRGARRYCSSATAAAILADTTFPHDFNATAYSNTVCPETLEFSIVTNATGTWTLLVDSEVATSAVTVMAGSYCEVR